MNTELYSETRASGPCFQTTVSSYDYANCSGRVNKETHAALAQWHMIGHQLFGSELVGDVFYMHAAIFEIPM